MKNKWFAVSLSGLLVFASCEKTPITTAEEDAANQTIDNRARRMSGEDMFREIVFFQGEDVASKIPTYAPYIEMINDIPEEGQVERITMIDRIVEDIYAYDGGYFDSFQERMLSDDPYTIEEALTNSSELVLTLVNAMPEYGEYSSRANEITSEIAGEFDLSTMDGVDALRTELVRQLDDEFPDIDLDVDVDFAVCVALALAAVVAAVVWEVVAIVNQAAVATVAVYALAVFWGPLDAEVSHLMKAEVVGSIVENY